MPSARTTRVRLYLCRPSPKRAHIPAYSESMSSAHEIELLLYSAPGCCLCETALQLEPLARELGFRVSEVDISQMRNSRPISVAAHPLVAELGGRVVFKYRMDEKRLRRLVEEAREAG